MQKYFLLGLFFVVVSLSAQQDKDRLDILKYGLEPDIKTLLVTLNSEKNLDFNQDISDLYKKTTNVNILKAIVEYALASHWEDFKTTVFENAEKLESMPLSAKLSVISIISEMKWKEAEPQLTLWADGKDKTLALAALRTLGSLGTESAGIKLLEKLRDPELDNNFKGDIYWALGELKYQDAFDELKDALEDSVTSPLEKRILIEALGKLKHPGGGDIIQGYLNDNNVLLRTEAMKALSNYPDLVNLTQLYLEGLRDSEAAVRIAAASALEKSPISELADVLIFRIKKDPDLKVRTAAMKGLLSVNQSEGKKFILHLLEEGKIDIPTWKVALSLAIDWPETIPVLENLAREELKKGTSGYFNEIVTAYTYRKQPGLSGLYTILMGSKSYTQRSAVLRGIQLNKTTELKELVRKAMDDQSLAAQAKKVYESITSVVESDAPKPKE